MSYYFYFASLPKNSLTASLTVILLRLPLPGLTLVRNDSFIAALVPSSNAWNFLDKLFYLSLEVEPSLSLDVCSSLSASTVLNLGSLVCEVEFSLEPYLSTAYLVLDLSLDLPLFPVKVFCLAYELLCL